MKLKAAFLFVAPEANYQTDRSVIDTPAVELISVGAANYAQAVIAAKELVEDGVAAIELCAGFGNKGTAMISEAVGDKAAVGVVRFDNHPGLDFKSGDSIFN